MIKYIKVNCTNCNKIFLKDQGHYRENIKFGYNFYCSMKCEHKYRVKRKRITCENCRNIFEKTPHEISTHNYCSQSCAAIVNNKNRPYRGGKIKICQQCKKNFRNIYGNKKYCSLNCRRISEQWKPKELIEIIRNHTKKYKRIPSKRELVHIDSSARKIFGSWNNAIIASGFIANRSHDDRMYKRVNAKAIDGHLCDSISELLIDNWLYKNGIPHERNVHYPETNHKADWKVFSNNKETFIEYFGLANDSPRYDRSIKEKEILCKRQNISLVGIYPKDLYPKTYLDGNLKNKLKEYLVS